MEYSDSAFAFGKKLDGQGFVVDTRTPNGKKLFVFTQTLTHFGKL